MKKRIFCLFLALTMLIGLLPAFTFGSSATISTTTDEVDSLFTARS